MKIRYIGTESYQEYPVTGTTALWQPEWVSDVSNARATALVALGTFVYEDASTYANQLADHAAEHAAMGDVPTVAVDPVTGRVTISGAGSSDLLYDAANFRQSDSGIDYIAYGLTLPTSGNIGIAALAAGVAYVSGYRVPFAGAVLSLTATSDNYIDIDNTGTVTVSAVTPAAAAPVLTANSIRLGYVTTNATAVTGATTGALDSNGVWMGNVSSQPHCRLAQTTIFGSGGGAEYAVTFGAGTTKEINASGMHSETTNAARITCTKDGVYFVWGNIILNAPGAGGVWTLRILKNGASATLGQAKGLDNSSTALEISHTCFLKVGDYITLAQQTVGSQNISVATFGMTRVG